MSVLKEQFITQLEGFKKAIRHMDSEASTADKIKWQPKFCKLLAELNDLEYQLRQSGEMTDEELHGIIENM
jgi:hypothetical protein